MFEKGKGRKGKTKGRGVLEKAFCRILAPGGDVKGVFSGRPALLGFARCSRGPVFPGHPALLGFAQSSRGQEKN